MEEEINEGFDQQKEYQMMKSKKEGKKDIKAKALVDLQRQKKTDLSDDEMLGNADIFEQKEKPEVEDSDYSENDNDLEEERMLLKLQKQ